MFLAAWIPAILAVEKISPLMFPSLINMLNVFENTTLASAIAILLVIFLKIYQPF